MCKRNEIECVLTPVCKSLCRAAEEYADQDYRYQRALLVSPAKIEAILSIMATHSRQDDQRTVSTRTIPMSLLNGRQRKAIEEMFFRTEYTYTYSELGRRLGIPKSTAHHRVVSALNILRAALDETP